MRTIALRRGLAVAAICLALSLANAASAASVQVFAEILGFTGQVGSDGQFVTYVDQHGGLGPEVICPDAGCDTGIGLATLDASTLGTEDLEFWNSSFGVEATRNRIRFESAGPVDVQLGEEFLLGTLTYTNGIWFTDPELTVWFTSASDDATFDGFVWQGALHLSITTNSATNTPAQNADFLWFTNLTTLGSVRAYELGDSPNGSNSVTVSIYGSISSVDLTRFADATGGGFLSSSVGLLPEPSVVALLATASLGLVRAGRRRK